LDLEGKSKGLSLPLLPHDDKDSEMARQLLLGPSTTTTTTTTTTISTTTSTTTTSTTAAAIVSKVKHPEVELKNQKQAIKASSIFGNSSSSKVVLSSSNTLQQQAIKKCIERGVDPKIFLLRKKGSVDPASKKLSTFSLQQPKSHDFKKKH